jgi:hypothetical protein
VSHERRHREEDERSEELHAGDQSRNGECAQYCRSVVFDLGGYLYIERVERRIWSSMQAAPLFSGTNGGTPRDCFFLTCIRG